MSKVDRFNSVFVGCILGFSALLLMWRLRALSMSGGGEFQHADWFINFSSGIIRRGFSGEILLTVAAALGMDPLLLVSLLQATLILMLIVAIYAKALQLGMSDRLTILLLSPALIVFWVNDTTGAYRKELLGLVSFLPLLFPVFTRNISAILALGLYTIAVFFHEVNLALAPAMAFAFYLRYGARDFVWPTAVLGAISLSGATFALIFTALPDTSAMCQRLLANGLDDQLCGGIIPWLAEGLDGTTSAVRTIVLEQFSLPMIALLTALLLLPGLWFGNNLLQSGWERIAFVAVPLSVFALYPIATDWSRWLSLQVFAMTFLILMLGETRRGLEKELPKAPFALILAFNLGVGIDQIAPTPLAGFAYNFFASAQRFF